jgi:hypothetical protein
MSDNNNEAILYNDPVNTVEFHAESEVLESLNNPLELAEHLELEVVPVHPVLEPLLTDAVIEEHFEPQMEELLIDQFPALEVADACDTVTDMRSPAKSDVSTSELLENATYDDETNIVSSFGLEEEVPIEQEAISAFETREESMTHKSPIRPPKQSSTPTKIHTASNRSSPTRSSPKRATVTDELRPNSSIALNRDREKTASRGAEMRVTSCVPVHSELVKDIYARPVVITILVPINWDNNSLKSNPTEHEGSDSDVDLVPKAEVEENKFVLDLKPVKKMLIKANDVVTNKDSIYVVVMRDFRILLKELMVDFNDIAVGDYYRPNALQWWIKYIHKLVLVFDRPSGQLSVLVDKKAIRRLIKKKMEHHEWMKDAIVRQQLKQPMLASLPTQSKPANPGGKSIKTTVTKTNQHASPTAVRSANPRNNNRTHESPTKTAGNRTKSSPSPQKERKTTTSPKRGTAKPNRPTRASFGIDLPSLSSNSSFSANADNVTSNSIPMFISVAEAVSSPIQTNNFVDENFDQHLTQHSDRFQEFTNQEQSFTYADDAGISALGPGTTADNSTQSLLSNSDPYKEHHVSNHGNISVILPTVNAEENIRSPPNTAQTKHHPNRVLERLPSIDNISIRSGVSSHARRVIERVPSSAELRTNELLNKAYAPMVPKYTQGKQILHNAVD